MLGFAALDRRDEKAAIWLVSHTDAAAADSTNAVVVDLSQPTGRAQVHALTRDRVVVLTPGSHAAGLPLSHPQPVELVSQFVAATIRHQEAIVAAVRAFRASRKTQLSEPSFPAPPQLPPSWPQSPQQRALALAQTLSRAWTCWLVSDGERLRRTTAPRTGETPWIMPEEMNQPELLLLPPALLDSLQPEPVAPFPG